MKILRDPDEVLAFFQNYSDPCVTALIQQRMEELTDADTSMEELVVFVILESGDGIEQLQTQIEMQVLTEQGAPLWEVIEEHATCYELVFVLSSSGYGTLVLAPKLVCEPDILALCQKHEKGVTGGNAARLLFWPAIIGTYMNANEAIAAAENRKVNLANLMNQKSCQVPGSYQSQK